MVLLMHWQDFARLSDNETVWLEKDPPLAVNALYLDSSILH